LEGLIGIHVPEGSNISLASFAWSYVEPSGSCMSKARYEASQNRKNHPLRKSRMEIQRQQKLLKLPLGHRLALYT